MRSTLFVRDFTPMSIPLSSMCIGTLVALWIDLREAGRRGKIIPSRPVMRALELAGRMRSWEPLEASLGVATLNSLIEPQGDPGNVFEHVARLAAGKTVTVIGRFPANEQIALDARAHRARADGQGDKRPNKGHWLSLSGRAAKQGIKAQDINAWL